MKSKDLLLKCAQFEALAAATPEYLREYMKKRYHTKRKEIIERLGGKCVSCGSTNDLHLDHIDKKKKTFRMSDVHSVADHRLEKELKNIQLLCLDCHKKKTHKNWDYAVNKPEHGTYWMYRKYRCRCKACVKAFEETTAAWRRKAKQKA